MAANSSLHSPSCDFPLINVVMPTMLALLSLTIPLLVFVLVVGFQRWRKQPFSSPFGTSSHIDILTYNLLTFMDLLCISGNYFTYFGMDADQLEVLTVGHSMSAVSSPGHTLLHLLTCAERYLAVVHPIFYLRLRGSAGVRMRNITIGCVWLTSIAVMTLSVWFKVSFLTLSLVLLSFTTVASCFCSSVLWVLIRPGPGEGGGDNRLSNQSKQRALHIMAMITATLLLMLTSSLIICVVQSVSVPFGFTFCVMGSFSVLFLLPTYLVLPLLFLQRVGKPTVCGHKPSK